MHIAIVRTGITTTMSEDSQAHVKLRHSYAQFNRWTNDPWVITDTAGNHRRGSFREYIQERCPDRCVGLDSSLEECGKVLSILSVFGTVQLDHGYSMSVTHVVNLVKELDKIISKK